MTEYRIVRSQERTFIFAVSGDFSSQIELIDSSPSEEVLGILRDNDVAPEHLQNVYDDLLFKENMV